MLAPVLCLVFSPQTRICPANDRLPFPSYARLLARIGKDAVLRGKMERHGDLSRLVPGALSSATIVCGGLEQALGGRSRALDAGRAFDPKRRFRRTGMQFGIAPSSQASHSRVFGGARSR